MLWQSTHPKRAIVLKRAYAKFGRQLYHGDGIVDAFTDALRRRIVMSRLVDLLMQEILE